MKGDNPSGIDMYIRPKEIKVETISLDLLF